MFEKRLPLDLQFFADGGEDKGGQATDQSQGEGKQGEGKQKQEDTMIPKSRFDEVNTKYKEMETKLQAIEKAQADADKAKQEEQGEYEKLYRAKEKEVEQLSTYKTRAEELEGAFGKMVDAKVEAIPEDYRELIPTGMTAEQKLDWITKAESKGMFKTEEEPPKQIGGRQGTNPKEAKRDTKDMNPMEKMLFGYTSKKKK